MPKLVALEAQLFAALCVRDATAGATAMRLLTDSLSSITSIEGLVAATRGTGGARDCGHHCTRVERCAELLRQSGADLDWTPGHGQGTELNRVADQQATAAMCTYLCPSASRCIARRT